VEIEFNEKFIDKGVAKLCEEYDKIRGQNVNIARITPSLIDGLKPVQRRALYIMFLKDGGKSLRKLATISGEVFGRVHPHCLHGDTEFILTNGTKKTIAQIYEEREQYYEVMTYDTPNKNITRAPLDDVRITKYVKEYHEIKLSSGSSIKCTNDHCILVMRPTGEKTKYHEDIIKPRWVPAEKIKPGDVIYGGEITHLSFGGKDVGHPQMYVPLENPLVMKSGDGSFIIRKESTIDQRSINGSDGTIWTIHAGIDTNQMVDNLKHSFIQVESVDVVKCDKEIPMYDFTVDKYGNGVIYCGSRNESSHSFVVVKNSPTSIEDAIVNIAQPWRNILPLVEGRGNWGCHDDITEVLTKGGWKLFKDITKDDLLASVNPDSGEIIYEHPTEIFDYEYEGDLIVGAHKSLNFAVTPNHKMLIKKYDSHKAKFASKFEFVEAQDLPLYSGLLSRPIQIKGDADPVILEEETFSKGNILPRVEISMDIWVQFLGIYLADGHMTAADWDKYPYKIINISVTNKPRKIMYYTRILRSLGFKDQWSESVGGFRFINKRIWNKLESYGLFKKRAPEKFIPDFIFDLDAKYIELFLFAYAMGDGSIEVTSGGGISYWTSSKKMAEQIQILELLCGRMSKIHIRDPRPSMIDGREIITKNLQYHVYEWLSKNQSIDRRKYLHREYYKGHVYCAEVPTYHTLITRRNGIILVSGNSASGAEAGASRYIYAKLSDYAIACFFEDWKESVVDTELAYDEETRMPEYLPAKYPNVLLNGCLGIGYGMSSNLPCFNFREVVEATVLLMLNPKAPIVLIPDSPTGADIIQTDFARICEKGTGVYMQRCTYEIDPEVNSITITSLPDLSTSRDICNKIAEIKEKGGLGELISMNDLSGTAIEIQLILRDDVNPYKFMRKLIKEVSGLQRSYPINVTVVDDYNNYDLSIKELLIEWIKWRREQKRAVLNNKRSTLVAEQRVTEVKMFIMNKNNLEDTIKIFRSSRNRQEIEDKLISKYKDTPIRMDSLQARALSNMRMVELTIDAYEACVKRAEELEKELASLEETLKTKNGVDKIIIAELRDGVKRFGKPRNSNVVPYKISVSNEVEGHCILQLSADGNIVRKHATNIEQEPIPTDSNGFACVVDNDASFILVDNLGMHTFVRVKDLPVDTEVPVFRYSKKPLNGSIVAMLPVDMESDKCCTIVSKNGIIKRIRINDIGPSKRPLISMEDGDSLIRGIVLDSKSNKKLIIYTKNGMGQLMENNSIKITSPSAKGGNGFKLEDNDEIIGIYAINPADVDYLLYITTKGKMRLNNIQFLPTRKNKHEAMVQLIQLPDRDKLLSIVGCNKLDVITVFYDDGTSEDININILPESTMSMEPKKVTKKNAVSNRIVKVKLK
jgi:DNA gyrase subunit A